MGLLDQSRKDLRAIMTNKNLFGIDIVFKAPGRDPVTIVGRHVKHHFDVNAEGQKVSSKQASISFCEADLLEADPDYPLRNGKGEVDLNSHKIDVADSTGEVKHYIARAWFPDETLGYIQLTLTDYADRV